MGPISTRGGDFIAADGGAWYLAIWDGTNWCALGSGVGDVVRALATDGAGHLFVGGDFIFAGSNPSPLIAQANIGATPGRFCGLSYSRFTGFSCTFSNATVGYSNRIQASPSLATGSWTDLTNFTYTGPISITDTSAVPVPTKFYRAISP